MKETPETISYINSFKDLPSPNEVQFNTEDQWLTFIWIKVLKENFYYRLTLCIDKNNIVTLDWFPYTYVNAAKPKSYLYTENISKNLQDILSQFFTDK